MKKIVVAIAAIAFLIVAILHRKGRSNGAHQKVIHLSTEVRIENLDPIHAYNIYQGGEVGKIYEGLMEYQYNHPPFNVVPNLAAEMPEVSDDGLIYTFKIRKGVKFHHDECFPNKKGRELQATDFVFSLKRLADPKLQSPVFSAIDGRIVGLNAWRKANAKSPETDYSTDIEGLQALDKYTLQIKLTKPYPQLLFELAWPWFFAVPHEAVSHYGDQFPIHPVGTGPFKLEKFDPQSPQLVYLKNPTYRDKRFPKDIPGLESYGGKRIPFLQKIVTHIIPEEHPRWLSFQNKELDLFYIPKVLLKEIYKKEGKLSDELHNKGIQAHSGPDLCIGYVGFNHHHPLFKNNLALRKALSLAINRKELIRLFFPKTTPAQSIIPPGVSGYEKRFINPNCSFDLEKAKKLLSDAGYPNGKGLPPISFDTVASTHYRQMGEYFKRSFAKIGVRLEVKTPPYTTLLQKLKNKSTMLYTTGFTSYPDGFEFLKLLYGPYAGGHNESNFNDTAFNKLFEEAMTMPDCPDRTSIYRKLNRMAAAKVPVIYLVNTVQHCIHQKWVKNFLLFPRFIIGREQYLAIDTKSKTKQLTKEEEVKG